MEATVMGLIISDLKNVLLDSFRYAEAFLTVTRDVVDETLSIDEAKTMPTKNVVRWLRSTVWYDLRCFLNQVKDLVPVVVVDVGDF